MLAEQEVGDDAQELAGGGALDDAVVVGADVSVITLEMPRRFSVSWEVPWNSAGYSIAPTPMITDCPGIRRGTECTVPMPPGLVSETVTPEKSSIVSLLSRARRTMSS